MIEDKQNLRSCEGQCETFLYDFLKTALEELFEITKHGDQEHQDWLENEFNNYLEKFKDKT